MTIADQITHLEARERDKDNKLEHERRRNDHQAGALRESRAQNAQLLKELAEARELIGTYQTHFHTFHGSAEHVKKQEQALAIAEKAAPLPVTPPVTEVHNSILGKLTRLGLKTEVAA